MFISFDENSRTVLPAEVAAILVGRPAFNKVYILTSMGRKMDEVVVKPVAGYDPEVWNTVVVNADDLSESALIETDSLR
jgi:hypothetical protein